MDAGSLRRMITYQLIESGRYNPWADLARNWPEISVCIEPMSGDLLGELRYPLITLRAGTSAAQRRCTLAHEIVHLERGVDDFGVFADREERQVHTIAAKRLIRLSDLAGALLELGEDATTIALAHALDVDRETLRVRLRVLSDHERAQLEAMYRDRVALIA